MSEPLALKYRPKTFADIVGQKPTRAVLAKIVESRVLPPSMIFAGVRGTGKTSMARIVAKAINCEHGEVEPCGECDHCVSVDTESAGFVTEIDAASHGGVDAMRQLVEDALYSSGGDWKVYVLDEVHSVSQQGFQVLLKTLEEPPPRTSFILVTTEPEKIPDTIHARSMFFRFAKITQRDIKDRLIEIAEAEEISVSSSGIGWIAENADGGMRDAIMILDQVHRLGDVTITEELLIGVFGEQSVGRWLDALLSGNPAKAVLVADELVSQHGSVGAMVDRALITLRNVLLAKAGQREMPRDIEQMVTGMSQGQVIEMIKKLWDMRQQVKQLGPDDRAAVVALSAELSRKPVEVESGSGPTEAAMVEAFGE
jgi:DNA polymerase-3 subunit gamma/tau